MQAIQIRCPNCDAILDVAGDAESVDCRYCGTSSRVQRRSRVFQIPMPMRTPSAARPDVPQLVARQVRTPIILMAVIGLAISAGLGVALLSIRHAVVASGGGGSREQTYMTWNGGGPAIVADVDGDGTDDAIGIARYNLDGDSMYLAAFSGKDGARIWQGERLGTYSDVYQGRVALAGTTLLWADPRANLHAFELATGKARWTRSPGEKVDAMCAAETGAQVLLGTADKRWTLVTLADGTMAPAPARTDVAHGHGHGHRDADAPPPCRALATDERETIADVTITDVFGDLPKVDGMDVRHSLQRGAGPLVVVGTRAPGRGGPALARVDEHGALRWKAEVPPTDPLRAKLSEPELVYLGEGDVVVAYEHQDGPPSLTSFDLGTGARRWDAPIRMNNSIVLSGLALSRTAVMVSSWGALQVFDRASGRAMFTVGLL